jgi:hypothetical protein
VAFRSLPKSWRASDFAALGKIDPSSVARRLVSESLRSTPVVRPQSLADSRPASGSETKSVTGMGISLR